MAHFDYLVNDPTDGLFIPKFLQPMPRNMQFTIWGYMGAHPTTEVKYSKEWQAACAYYSIVQSIDLANKFLKNPLRKWAATRRLFVHPQAGKQLNAFYDRRSVKFYFHEDKKAGKIVFTSNSSDIVCHELGHAILDAIRPDLYNIQAIEIWAFHEAFGDIHATLNSLQHEEVIDHILKETDGDLKKSNLVSKLAEEMGNAVFNVTRGRMGHSAASLRNLANKYVYINPGQLPPKGKDNQLTKQPHNFSRVFSGAWYDIFVGVYEKLCKKMSQKEAVVAARDYMATCTYGALPLAAAGVRFFNAMARAMLVVDKNLGSRHNDVMNQCFIARNILMESVKPMLALDFDTYKDWTDENDEILEEKFKVITNKSVEIISMPHYMINVEAPGDVYYEFDEDGYCVDVVADSADEVYSHVNECVDFLKENDMIRPDKIAPFEIDQKGNLVRTNFACCFCKQK